MDQVDQQFELHPVTIDQNEVVVRQARTNTTVTSSSDGDVGKGVDASSSDTAVSAGTVPMSMPSIVRNPGMSTQSNHLAYLLDRRTASSCYAPTASRTKVGPGRSSKELGRRKQRRSENARLLSNPHTVRPSLKDYRLDSNEIRSTFHHSPCSSSALKGNQHNLPVPSNSRVGYSAPVHDAISAQHGHFGKSLKDAQRMLKRLEVNDISDDMIRTQRAGELERFIWLVDREIRLWSQDEVHVFAHGTVKDAQRKIGRVLLDQQFNFTRPPLAHLSEEQYKAKGVERRQSGSGRGSGRGEEDQDQDQDQDQEALPTVSLDMVQPGEGGQLIEFQRTPNALVWLVHDPFLRLVVHCLARVSRCPSFSKDDSSRPGLRFTWILNRNPLARRARRGRRVSISSSAMSISANQSAPSNELDPHLQLRTIHAPGDVLETPPTTDLDSHTETETEIESESESEIDAETEPDSEMHANSMGGSIVIVQPVRHFDAGNGGKDGEQDQGAEVGTEDVLEEEEQEGAAVDTDEEQAEILRRVRRWAIDSHRQRASQAQGHHDDDNDNADGGDGLLRTTWSSRRGDKVRLRSMKGANTQTEIGDPDQTLTATVIAEDDDEKDEANSFSDA